MEDCEEEYFGKPLEKAVLSLEKSITIIHLLFEDEATWRKAELLWHLLHDAL